MYTSNVENNKNYEWRKPVMEKGKETITISREEFVDACAKVSSSNEHVRELLAKMPELFLVFIMFSTELEKELFGEEK